MARPTHLLFRHPIAQFTQPDPHLLDIDKTFIAFVETRKRLEDIVFPILFDQRFAHHTQELRAIDPVGGIVS